jgi:hypothetical protein
MKATKLLAIAALGAALASCAAWRDVTVNETAADPVTMERGSVRMDANAASYTADDPRDQRRAGLAEGGAGGAGGMPR